ncbi:MAG: hypothetical protein LE169_00920 [Endomicrobium sp.]|nr:hypothetical protein [Endomicrobium sp.]
MKKLICIYLLLCYAILNLSACNTNKNRTNRTDLIDRTNSNSLAVPTKTNYPRVTILSPIINILAAGYEAYLILKKTTLRNMFRFETLLPLGAVSLNSYYCCKKNTLPAGNQEEYENQIKSVSASAMSAFMHIIHIEETLRQRNSVMSIPIIPILMQFGGDIVRGIITSLYAIKKKPIPIGIWSASLFIDKLLQIHNTKSHIDTYLSAISNAWTNSNPIISIVKTLINMGMINSNFHEMTEVNKELMNDLSNSIIMRKLWNYAKPFYEKYKIIRYGLAGIAAVFVNFPKIYIWAKTAWTATNFLCQYL